jgi:hypothetical protein
LKRYIEESTISEGVKRSLTFLKGGPAKMRDQNTRATLIEAVIAGGLIAVGIAACQPLVALASSVAGVGVVLQKI